MWFADVIQDSMKRMKPTFPWGSAIRRPDPQPDTEEDERPPAVAERVTRAEFALRYRHLRQVMFSLIGLIIADLVIFALVSGWIANGLCLSVLLIYAVFYLRYAFTAWSARWIWAHWSRRQEPSTATLRDFLDALARDPGLLWPAALPPAKQHTK